MPHTIAASASTVLLDFFAELDRRGIAAVILHSYKRLPEQVDSDIDFAVSDASLRVLPALAAEVALAHGWVLAQALWHEVAACYLVLVDPWNPAAFLKLDACSHYVRQGRVWIDNSTLLARRDTWKELPIPSPAAEFAYVLAKMHAKAKPFSSVALRLRELHAADPGGTAEQLRQLTGETDIAACLTRTDEDWCKVAFRASRRISWVLETMRRWRRAMQPSGCQIVVFGPDGVGKTTLIEQLARMLEPCFRRHRIAHFRPNLLADRSGGGVVTDPQGQTPRGILASFAKAWLYFFDHLLGWLARTRPALARSTLYIFDRHFADTLVDPRRYRMQGVSWLLRVLRYLVPKPDLCFVLEADPASIGTRKSELTSTEIARQQATWRKLLANDTSTHFIDANRPPADVAGEVARIALGWLSRRTHRREHIPSPPDAAT